MNILVCVKMAPDAGDIEVRGDGSISIERAEWQIGSFDLQAVEAGARLAEALGGTLTALSAGPREAGQSKLKKDILSRGPDQLTLVLDEQLRGADTSFTAQVLAAAVRKLGGFDLILCGEGSADLYFQQVGLQLGELLGLPTLNAVAAIQPADGCLVIERSLEDEVEVLEVPLPAVLSVTTDIHPPRLPKMTDILKASKKTVTEWGLGDLDLPDRLANQLESISTRAPRQVQRKRVLIPGTAEEAAHSLVNYLAQDGLL